MGAEELLRFCLFSSSCTRSVGTTGGRWSQERPRSGRIESTTKPLMNLWTGRPSAWYCYLESRLRFGFRPTASF